MMDYMISEKSWHAILFRLASASWSKWIDKPDWIYQQPNLCLYIRTLTLWLPLMVVINLGVWTSPIWVSWMMVNKYGSGIMFGSWWGAIKLVVIVGSFLFLVFVVLPMIYEKLRDIWRSRQASLPTTIVSEKTTSQAKIPSLFHVVAQALRDRHDMICRSVTFVSVVEPKKE